MVSLAMKTTTQHIIVGQLSAFARKNKIRHALWEYDNMIRSLYLLDYIDSPPLRQHVQRALNRGESYLSCAEPFPTPISGGCASRLSMNNSSGASAPASSPTASSTTTRCCFRMYWPTRKESVTPRVQPYSNKFLRLPGNRSRL